MADEEEPASFKVTVVLRYANEFVCVHYMQYVSATPGTFFVPC
jgi:hypothetical protein